MRRGENFQLVHKSLEIHTAKLSQLSQISQSLRTEFFNGICNPNQLFSFIFTQRIGLSFRDQDLTAFQKSDRQGFIDFLEESLFPFRHMIGRQDTSPFASITILNQCSARDKMGPEQNVLYNGELCAYYS